MPLISDTAAALSDFDGTPGNGEIDFPGFSGISTANDTVRAMVTSLGLSSSVDMATVSIRLASSKAQHDAGNFVEVGYAEASRGVSLVACHILVPVGFLMFFVTTGAANAIKYLNVDWQRVELTTRFGGS